MKRLIMLVVSAAALSAAIAHPAVAAGRPADGCAKAYTLTTIAVLQELAQEAPDEYFVNLDVNRDGFLCNKFLPDASVNVGIARDNFVAGY
jgi:hypothetical protein